MHMKPVKNDLSNENRLMHSFRGHVSELQMPASTCLAELPGTTKFPSETTSKQKLHSAVCCRQIGADSFPLRRGPRHLRMTEGMYWSSRPWALTTRVHQPTDLL